MNAPVDRPTRNRLIVAACVLIGVVAGVAAFTSTMANNATSPGAAPANQQGYDYDYVIPAGTQTRIEAGESVDVVPAELEVRVGESLRIVNDDDVDHVVGVFFVPAGATLEQYFSAPGERSGDCDVHSSGTFRLVVRP